MEGTKFFAEAPDVSLRLVGGIVGCKEFVVHDGNVFCLTSRNTLVALPSHEEYEFYEDILGMGIHEHYIYLVFMTSKIIVFDAICREVVVNFPGMGECIRKVVVSSNGMYLLSENGFLYKSGFGNIKYVKQAVACETEDRRSAIQDFWVDGDSVFYATHIGHVYRDSRMILKAFDAVRMLVPHSEHLYIVTGRNLLLKYNTRRLRVLFKADVGSSRVIRDHLVACDGTAIDLSREVFMKIPKDARCIVRAGKTLYVLTPSGVFAGASG
ncbi:hypothetical protein [Encephalitozoon cuniculi GB-M1]|uniref:Uncharacterized protein n=1 Tax=Encephalitozoon cuniculi (strain GB-M1) TaxID=284813 RepID=Q8SVW4_ENCCU|nr:uncharacterized protein ECU04_0470 [Encephalitozoon cuniculi GB-M1]CAD25234.1 hypothetical protein [Encephalitozoon cuniculi GB-M1]